MKKFPTNELLQICGLHAMANLCENCDANRRRLLIMGAAELVAHAYTQFSKSESVRRAAKTAEAHLAGNTT
jgi:hypothetical protein